jgi:hypothetical protein
VGAFPFVISGDEKLQFQNVILTVHQNDHIQKKDIAAAAIAFSRVTTGNLTVAVNSITSVMTVNTSGNTIISRPSMVRLLNYIGMPAAVPP